MKKIVIAGIFLAGLVAAWAMIPSGWEIRNENPSGDEILCFGDSLTYGTGAKEGMDYPSRLSKIIGLPVINLGVPGDTTETALSRLEEDVLSGSPQIVLITLGGNDLKNRFSKEKAFGNLRKNRGGHSRRGRVGGDRRARLRSFRTRVRQRIRAFGKGNGVCACPRCFRRHLGPPGSDVRCHPSEQRRLRHHGGPFLQGHQTLSMI